MPWDFVTVDVCRLHTDGGVQDVPDLDEFFDDELHVRTGKVYYRNSTFRVYYHQRPSYSGRHAQFPPGSAIIFQLDNTGKVTFPDVDNAVFFGVILM